MIGFEEYLCSLVSSVFASAFVSSALRDFKPIELDTDSKAVVGPSGVIVGSEFSTIIVFDSFDGCVSSTAAGSPVAGSSVAGSSVA